MQIQEIADGSGYIENIAAPHAVAVASQARIAAAKADQEAFEREQQAAALKAQYQRDTTIKQAGFQAEVEQARARAAQARLGSVLAGARWVTAAGGCDFVPGWHAGRFRERVVRGQGGWAAPHGCDFAPGWHAGGSRERVVRGQRWVGGAPGLGLCSWVASWQALAACHPGARWVGAPSRGEVGGRGRDRHGRAREPERQAPAWSESGRPRTLAAGLYRGSALACAAQERRSLCKSQRGVAQLVEHRSPKPAVAGSSPVAPAERQPARAVGVRVVRRVARRAAERRRGERASQGRSGPRSAAMSARANSKETS
jgi:hypothetical protein